MDPDIFGEKLGVGFISAFISSLCVIVVSEIGDKTFFIAAIFSMKYSRLVVFLGSMFALVLMTVLSAFLGYATTVIPHWITHYLSAFLFFVFGMKMLYDAYSVNADEAQNEYENVKSELEDKEQEFMNQPTIEIDIEQGKPLLEPSSSAALISSSSSSSSSLPGPSPSSSSPSSSSPSLPPLDEFKQKSPTTFKSLDEERHWKKFISLFSPVFIQSFILTFVAEWGDRSQLSTIILAAKNNLIGVIMGGVLGHSLCTGLAVLAGRFVAQRISLRTVHLVGALVFILSALYILCFEDA